MNPEINPLGFNYGTDVTAVVPFAKPTAIIVTGRGNRYDPAFQEARKRGALVQAYWNPFNIPVGTKNPQDLEQWMGDTAKVPRWRFNGTGPVRSNWENTELADIRPGSAWRVHFRNFSEDIILRKLFDGFFLDTLGVRPWAADWESWPVAEQKLWAECAVDLAREMHELRAKIAPEFELVHNNFWHLPSSHPAHEVAKLGDKYCNGVCFENTPPDKSTGDRAQFHINYAARTFAGPPYARRVLVVMNTKKMFDQWKEDPNVTHITFVDSSKDPVTGKPRQNYMKITPPLVPYNDLSGEDPELPSECEQKLAEMTTAVEALHAENDELKRVNASQQSEISGLRERLTQIAPLAEQITALTKP